MALEQISRGGSIFLQEQGHRVLYEGSNFVLNGLGQGLMNSAVLRTVSLCPQRTPQVNRSSSPYKPGI